MLNKKGAMFGLDARIALAIFGALSVISGAALYSAIKYSKTVSLASTLTEVVKSIEAYFLDMGSFLPYTTSPYHKMEDLIVNPGDKKWKGPYIGFIQSTSEALIKSSDGTSYYLVNCSDTFGNSFSTTGCGNCFAVKCDKYLRIQGGVVNKSMAYSLDDYFDNGDGFDKGKIRVQWADATESDNLRLYYYTLKHNK